MTDIKTKPLDVSIKKNVLDLNSYKKTLDMLAEVRNTTTLEEIDLFVRKNLKKSSATCLKTYVDNIHTGFTNHIKKYGIVQLDRSLNYMILVQHSVYDTNQFLIGRRIAKRYSVCTTNKRHSSMFKVFPSKEVVDSLKNNIDLVYSESDIGCKNTYLLLCILLFLESKSIFRRTFMFYKYIDFDIDVDIRMDVIEAVKKEYFNRSEEDYITILGMLVFANSSEVRELKMILLSNFKEKHIIKRDIYRIEDCFHNKTLDVGYINLDINKIFELEATNNPHDKRINSAYVSVGQLCYIPKVYDQIVDYVLMYKFKKELDIDKLHKLLVLDTISDIHAERIKTLHRCIIKYVTYVRLSASRIN